MPTASTKDILRRLQEKPLVRTIAVERKGIDPESRTVQLAFATNRSIDEWFGRLSLSMDPKAMRSDRLRSGAPLLLDHNTRDQIGVIENHSIGRDGIARAIVRFSKSTRAEEIFQDVRDGIRKNVSVGFMIHKLDLVEQKKGQLPTYRSDDWEPFEISIVSVPADIAAGVGRSKQNVRNRMKNRTFASPVGDDEDDASEFRSVHEEIAAWADSLGGRDGEATRAYLRSCVVSGSEPTMDGFRAAVRAAQPKPVRVPPEDPRDQAYRQGGIVYEPATVNSRHTVRNFTGEGADEKAYRFGQWLLGGPCGNASARRWCAERGLLGRAMSEGVNEKGGYLVPEEFGSDLIMLIEKHGVFRRNAKVRTMESDMRSDPLLTDELDSEFVGESQEGNDQDLSYSRVALVAKKHMILVPFSSELSEDSSLAIGDELAGASARAFAKKEDLCGFVGDATSPYGGMVGITTNLRAVDATIANIPGLQVGSGNAYSELALVDFEGVAARLPEYADENAKWYVSKKFYFNVMLRLLLSAGGTTPSEIEAARNRKFLGYDVEFTQVMPTAESNSQICALLGDLSMGALFGDRRSIRIQISDQALIRQDDLLFKATERFDVNSAFGVGDTSAAGPIVGLITAAS